MPKGDAFRWSLLLNGLDYIATALEALTTAQPSIRNIKYATLHLAAGVELVLKERLRRKDWRLLFPDPASADKAAFRAGAFKSIDRQTAIHRLDTNCLVRLEENGEDELEAFAQRRNRYQHFEVKDTRDAAIASAARVSTIALKFVADHLSKRMTIAEAAEYEKARVRLTRAEAIVEHRRQEIAPELERADWIGICPDCREHALIIEDGLARCLFCLYRAANTNQGAMDYLMGPRRHWDKDFNEQISTCPECGGPLVNDDLDHHICFGCGMSSSELKECSSCGDRHSHLIGAVCENCFEAAVERD